MTGDQGQSEMRLLHKACFRLRERCSTLVASTWRKAWWRAQGLRIGRTKLARCHFTWPHQVRIGDACVLEDDIDFKHDGIWSAGPSIVIHDRVFIGRGCEFNVRRGVTIGADSLIAAGCKFIDHDHGYADANVPMRLQPGPEAAIVLASNVWLGANVCILKGVTIGEGAIVASGAVVTKSIPARQIWGGVPAAFIKART